MPPSTFRPETPRPLLEATKSDATFCARRRCHLCRPRPASADPADKRGERRWRTHLRSGKIADGCTCILDSKARSATARRAARG